MTVRRCRSGFDYGVQTDFGTDGDGLDLLAMNRIQLIGIESAYSSWLPVARGLYATARPTWRSPWQVSGHLHSGTKRSALPSSLAFLRGQKHSEIFSFGLSPSKQTMQELRRAMICVERISRAVNWPIGATRTGGRRRRWQRVSNVWDSTSAAKWWLSLKRACVACRTTGSLASKRFFAFPSAGFFRRRFRIQMRSLANVIPLH